MFFDDSYGALRILVIAPLAYIWLIAVLRITGKRTLAQLNAFDFIVTVALGSTLATVIMSDTVSFVEGALGLALLATLQLAVAWLSLRVRFFGKAITSKPVVLFADGKPRHDALRENRVTETSLHQMARSSGVGDLDLIAWIVLETNGKISVIPRSQAGSGSAVAHIDS